MLRDLDRRQLLLLLAAAGCAPRRATVAPVPDGPVVLGWRWVPGTSLTFRTVISRTAAGRTVRRAEQWTYLVRDVDLGGVATLEGRLSGLGLAGDPAREAVVAERRATDTPVTLRLGDNGRFVSCSVTGLDRALPHRLLALRLPRDPVVVHDEWPATDLARPFARLLPGELEVAVTGSTRLLELYPGDRAPLAALATDAAARARADGPSIALTGRSTFEPRRGLLLQRTVEARFLPAGELPGLLTLELALI